ncbi:MAG: ribosomal protein L7/L12 [Archangiaceae bacterium]|nr:ribosomal protein L7/L12 [Archangiaceae bacterium]
MLLSDLQVTHRTETVNGLKYHWVEKGDGPLVVLLHGFPENWWSWRYQLEPLSHAGLRVIAPDLRGNNDTEKKGPYDLDTLAADVGALINAAGEQKAHVVGHAWGGALAWRLAATEPRFVDKLVVLNCPHPARMLESLHSSPEMMKKSWYFLFFQLPWLPELLAEGDRAARLMRVYRGFTRERAHFSQGELQPFIDALDKPGAAKAMHASYRAVFMQAIRDGFRSAYPSIDRDVLMMFARDDDSLRYQDLIPGTEKYAPRMTVKGFDHCGRFLHAEQPNAINDAMLEFLVSGAVNLPKKITGELQTEFDVVLQSPGENKITVIKEIRALCGLDLKEARDLVEGAPSTVKQKTSLVEALRIKELLTAVGAKIDLR